ncbi:MFS transporter [Pseudaminobacter sp. 19-2017]|uniref:MFS transporter n=1 Tax=Pseudaminobacter soli (ex Zhang et al. 2022) TaxID=2831468 RepID=A0A942E793_9HYPH|nr:MFS transporter [Pseudaminobacter soli]MBS3652226.1 MFS transporter [Pseudaminobacter soli]
MAGISALAVAYVLSQFYRSFLAVLTPVLGVELGVTKADLSIASGAFYLTFALSQFPIGVALDRIGPRKTVAIVLALGAGGGTLLFALATGPWMIVAATALTGIGCGPVLMAALFIFARLYSPARFAMLASWLVAFGTAGNVIGTAPLAYAEQAFGWRATMAGLCLVTLAVAAALYILVRDPERQCSESAQPAGFSGYAELLRMPVLWAILPLMTFAYAPSIGIRGLWAGPYLADVFAADVLGIGRVTFFMALAMVAGSFIYGPLDQFFGTRKWVAVGGTMLSMVSILALGAFPDDSVTASTVLLMLVGLAGASYGLLMAHGRAFLPSHLIGRGVTLMNFFAIGGVALMQFATGWVVTSSMVPEAPEAAYRALFLFIGAVLGASLLIYLFSRDAKPDTVS